MEVGGREEEEEGGDEEEAVDEEEEEGGDEGEGMGKRVDYGLSLGEESVLAMLTQNCSWIQSEAQVVQYDDSGSKKAFYTNASSVAFVFFCCSVSCLILVVSSFVAFCTNDMD